MKILLPIDGLDDSKLIMDFVLKYQWPGQVEFRVLHVVGSNDGEAQAKNAEQEAHVLVDQVGKRLKSLISSAKVTAEVRFGSATCEIVDAAIGWGAQMIVMGYRTRPNVKPFFTGSVANGVATVAPCSVAIIRPDTSATATGAITWEEELEEIKFS